jgi:hypothetical protein
LGVQLLRADVHQRAHFVGNARTLPAGMSEVYHRQYTCDCMLGVIGSTANGSELRRVGKPMGLSDVLSERGRGEGRMRHGRGGLPNLPH